jgi:very-short-patch-repair endonuclease
MTRISPTAKQNSRSLRQEMTDAEKTLWRHLRMRQMGGYKFRRQHPLGRYILDFVCLEANLVIEIDGGQHAERQNADACRSTWLEERGFRIVRFWNNEVLKDIENVKAAIWNALDLNDQPPSQPSRTHPHPNLPLEGEGTIALSPSGGELERGLQGEGVVV